MSLLQNLTTQSDHQHKAITNAILPLRKTQEAAVRLFLCFYTGILPMWKPDYHMSEQDSGQFPVICSLSVRLLHTCDDHPRYRRASMI